MSDSNTNQNIDQLREENKKLKEDIQRHDELIKYLFGELVSIKKKVNPPENNANTKPPLIPLAKKIIQDELLQYKDDDSCRFTIDTEDDSLAKLRVTVSPSENSPYSEGIFFLTMYIPIYYPFYPPKIKSETKIYHPNINEDGYIDFEEFESTWKPSYTIKTVIESFNDLLEHPHWYRGMVPSIVSQYEKNPSDYERTAREWTQQYAV